jgi:hypothetical protein
MHHIPPCTFSVRVVSILCPLVVPPLALGMAGLSTHSLIYQLQRDHSRLA